MTKFAVLIILSLSFGVGLSAQDASRTIVLRPVASVALWPEGEMPGHGAAQPEGDLPARPDGFRRTSNVSRPTLTIYPSGKSHAPAVIVAPGGGYSYMVVDKEGAEIAEWLNKLGITAFLLRYRVPDNRAGALQDMQRAISLVRSNAAEWKVDARRIGAIGFSAGGHLAAVASTQFGKRSYDPVDAVDKVSARPDFAMLIYPAYLEKDGKVAPELDLTAKIPPTLIVSTEDDKNFVAGCKIYHAALDAAKHSNQFLLYPTGGHGYGLRSDKDVRVWPEAASGWLRKNGIIK